MNKEILDLLEFCETERQREFVRVYAEHPSPTTASKFLGISVRNFQRGMAKVRQRAAMKGFSPSHQMVHSVPDPYYVKGVSTLYNGEGSVSAQWVKSSIDKEKQIEIMREIVAAMSEEIKPEKPVATTKKKYVSDLVNNFVITDYHLGMKSWPEETGASWDLDIAELALTDWFRSAVSQSPDAETAIVAILGDFIHWDGLDAVTPSSGHVLDTDTRFQLVVRVAIRSLRRIVKTVLEKHKKVRLIVAEGNHDPASSIWMREWLEVLYEDEPRISIDKSADPYYCYEHGKTSIFFHHGHKRKMENLDTVFAAKFRDVFGRTDHSYCHTGHYHHNKVNETNLMIVEQHRTLAASDAYSSRGGWVSGRDAKVITYHKKYGEVSRIIVSYDMIRA